MGLLTPLCSDIDIYSAWGIEWNGNLGNDNMGCTISMAFGSLNCHAIVVLQFCFLFKFEDTESLR